MELQSNGNELSRPENTLSDSTLETTDICVHSPASCIICQYQGSDEVAAVKLSVSITDEHQFQVQAASSGSQHTHEYIQEVGQMAAQCTSPQNSYNGNSTYTYVGMSSPHAPLPHPANSSMNSSPCESSDTTDNEIPYSFSSVETTPNSSHMMGPQSYFTYGTNSHPDDALGVQQQREDAANANDLRQLVDSVPNNDAPEVQRQRSYTCGSFETPREGSNDSE